MLGVRAAMLLAVVIGLAGCKRTASTPAPAASAAPPVAVMVDAGPPKRAAPSDKPAFLHVAPLTAGPVVVKGYPHNIWNGMNEYADHFGFSADSTLLVYGWEMGGIGGTAVEILARDGSKRSMINARSGDEKADPKFDAKQKDLEKFIADEKIAALPKSSIATDGTNAKQLGPPLTGTWKYTDITLDVVLIDASGGTPSTGPTHPAHVQVGGTVAGEKQAVHPISLAANAVPQAPPHFATLNGFAMSPDGEEFGLLENTFACEYCIDFAVRRIGVGELASLVYNDTGYRHHQKKEWAAAATLFEKAVDADPKAKLAAYNLACAWARLGDPRTKDALAYAITLDPTVKTRAQKDDDLASVRAEPWFPKP
jgi:hypothetical protein